MQHFILLALSSSTFLALLTLAAEAGRSGG